MKRFILPLLFIVGFASMAIAQRTVSGTITDSDGESLIGASVVAKGSTIGTITDIDGNFTLEVPAETEMLEVSYTGYSNQMISLGASNIVDVTLEEGVLLDEVVVSALGVERNSRDVSYANQTVSSEDLNSSPNKNALEALRGKAAGVRITTGSGSVGASNRIVLRGENSFGGNNNALIVIDGVPIDNSASSSNSRTNALSNAASGGYADFGNRFNDYNPEDIESITILKGPSATSLYGSRGASGVVMITTKKGTSDGDFEIGYNGTYSVQSAYVLLKRQDKYGQGFGIPFASEPSRDSGENWSWGPAFDGVVRPWTSPVDADGDGDYEYLSRPYNAVTNQLENFFNTGTTMTNSVNLAGSKGGFNYYASYGNTTQDGILDNTSYNRNAFKFSAGTKLFDKLTTNFSVNYSIIDQQTAKEGSRPFEGQNAYSNAIQSPVNIPLNELRDYNSPFHNFDGYYGSYTVNPYFILNENTNSGNINNLLANLSLKYDLMDNLSVSARLGANNVTTDILSIVPQYAYNDHYIWNGDLIATPRGGRDSNGGQVSELRRSAKTYDITLLADYRVNLTSDISLNLTPGVNRYEIQEKDLQSNTVGGIVIPDFYHLSNSVNTPTTSQYILRRRIIGAFTTARFGWQDKVFLEYSARNDWSSTLPKGANSFFYQAFGASAVMSDIFDFQDSPVNFFKLRASYGTTGKDAAAYRTSSTFLINPTIQNLNQNHTLEFPHNNQAGATVSDRIGNSTLKPEKTTTLEFGTDVAFLDDRINLSYTYYKSDSKNQIVAQTVSPSTGFTSVVKNIGGIQNKGHEITLGIKPIIGGSNGFNLSFDFAYAKNTNTVTSVDPEAGIDEFVVETWFGGSVAQVAAVGRPYGTFKALVDKTDANGNVVVDASGLPLASDEAQFLGSFQPDWTGGLVTTIGYKGVSLGAVLDIKQGGQFLSYTKDLTEFNGTALTTDIGDRTAFVVPNTVDTEGNPNTIEVAPYDYIRNRQNGDHLIDASYMKLREITLKYGLPKSLINKLPFKSASIGVFAQNVKFWLPEENTFADPEINGPALSGNGTGVETTQTPPARSFGMNLSFKF